MHIEQAVLSQANQIKILISQNNFTLLTYFDILNTLHSIDEMEMDGCSQGIGDL